MGELDGRVYVVTAGASFLGEAIGADLVEAGASVVLADRDDEHGAASAARLGDRVSFVRTDVTKDEELDRLIGGAVERHGRLDGAVGATADFEDLKLASDRSAHARDVARAARTAARIAALEEAVAELARLREEGRGGA